VKFNHFNSAPPPELFVAGNRRDPYHLAMARLTLDLPEDLRSKLQARANETGHASIEEHVAALIRADLQADYGAPDPLKVRSQDDLEARLLEGLQSPASEMTDADWDDMRQRFQARHPATGPR
jgi:antitoxin ParD1/3/4